MLTTAFVDVSVLEALALFQFHVASPRGIRKINAGCRVFIIIARVEEDSNSIDVVIAITSDYSISCFSGSMKFVCLCIVQRRFGYN